MPGTGELIILNRGERGCYHSDMSTQSKWENKGLADFYNHRRGISPAQVMAMLMGSLHGFDKPEANPQSYFDEARHISTHLLGLSAVLYADNLHCEHIEGNVYQYQVAGEMCSYLDLASMPEAMMGIHSEGIILLDMVHGKPLVPVALKWMEDGGCEMNLERGAFTSGKEMNENYQITAKVRVGLVEYVLCELDGKFPGFVTWERTPANDGNGPPNYYWGHYYENRSAAIRDFCDRAQAKYEMLLENRKPSVKTKLSAAPVSGKKPPIPKDREAR